MATYRNPDESTLTGVTAPATYNIGNIPPLVNWTCVIGDSASFRIYVEDDLENPLDYDTTSVGDDAGWDIKGEFRRYSDNVGDDCFLQFSQIKQNLTMLENLQSVYLLHSLRF
jgi:hypothetical protein